jgi:hypothetical protein
MKMKIKIKRYPLLSKKTVIASVIISLVFSCSKSNNNPASAAVKYCTNLGWSDDLGLSGQFAGAYNNLGHFTLSKADSYKKDGTANHVTFQSANGHFIDQGDMKFTYDKDNLVALSMGNSTTGQASFSFDTNGHLKSTVITNYDASGDLSMKIDYTYDNNDDPVKILINSQTTFPDGNETVADYVITADYLTDKTSVLPFVPEITPFTGIFAYSYFLSRHLINKWDIVMNENSSNGAPVGPIKITLQYNYTYDSNGRVATMSSSANNTFTFTYSGCN